MEWSSKIGRHYVTKRGTARVHAQYWIKHNGVGNFTAGYEGFGMMVTFTDRGADRIFKTVGQAKKYCEMKDSSAILITEVVSA